MNLSVGIVGLPNAGKSTLFNALLSRQIASVAPYPFCTIEPNVGVVEVPDRRLQKLAEVVKEEERMEIFPPKVPAIVEFKDIAGLVEGAARGEGLGNKFLAHIRESAAIVHVLRAFEDERVIREGEVNPKKDFEIVKTELCLADLQTLEKQKEPNLSFASNEEKKRWETILKLKEWVGGGREVREGKWDEDEEKVIRELFLLTAKPAIFVLNVNENDIKRSSQELAKFWGLEDKGEIIPICAKTEMELAELEEQERRLYLNELGLEESGLERLIRRAYEILELQTFFTAGVKEVRAWTIKQGTRAPQAAGVIHTDFERGFIKAQVVSFDDFIKAGGWKKSFELGKVRLEGKDYIMKEGDIVEFKFNV